MREKLISVENKLWVFVAFAIWKANIFCQVDILLLERWHEWWKENCRRFISGKPLQSPLCGTISDFFFQLLRHLKIVISRWIKVQSLNDFWAFVNKKYKMFFNERILLAWVTARKAWQIDPNSLITALLTCGRVQASMMIEALITIRTDSLLPRYMNIAFLFANMAKLSINISRLELSSCNERLPKILTKYSAQKNGLRPHKIHNMT